MTETTTIPIDSRQASRRRPQRLSREPSVLESIASNATEPSVGSPTVQSLRGEVMHARLAADEMRPEMLDASENPVENRCVQTADPELVAPVCGLRLGDLQRFVKEHWSWLEERTNGRRKTMYDVCPELLIPMTTTQEVVVTLMREDVQRLKPSIRGGVFVSDHDLTLDPALGKYIRLGGRRIPTGATVHGRLAVGGPVRRLYWTTGSSRADLWRTMQIHGRVPLSGMDTVEASTEVGEEQDKISDATSLREGSIVVLRQGISFCHVCAGDGPGFPLHNFVSHWWGEETLDFTRALELHAQNCEGIAPSERVYYICTFNNNQHRVDLGDSLKESPFNKALAYISSRAAAGDNAAASAVMILDPEATPLRRKWCVYEAWRCADLSIPLRLFCEEGEITRGSKSEIARAVRASVERIDVEQAGCSRKEDADLIHRAIEDSHGGFSKVHAKLKLQVTDLISFVGSMALSIDRITCQTLKEVELCVRFVRDKNIGVLETSKISYIFCAAAAHAFPEHDRQWCEKVKNVMGDRLLMVAPAGSGKTVFTRALVRHAIEVTKSSFKLMPIRVPLADLARTSAAGVADRELLHEWARKSFLHESHAVTENSEHMRMMILDGFDEAGPHRANIMSWLRSWLPEQKNIKTFISTRPSGVDNDAAVFGIMQKPKTLKVLHIDGRGRLGLSEPLSYGSFVEVEGLKPLGCQVLTSESGLAPHVKLPIIGQRVNLGVPPGSYGPFEVKASSGGGSDARVSIHVARHKIVDAQVVSVGSGYASGDSVLFEDGYGDTFQWLLPECAICYFTTFHRVACKEAKEAIDTSTVQLGDFVREVCVRTQLVDELGFCELEVEPIDDVASSTILENVSVDAAPEFDLDAAKRFLHLAPTSLKDRPLIAQMFAQYLTSPLGVIDSQQLKTSDAKASNISELVVFQFAISKFLAEAAEKTALPVEQIRAEISRICFSKFVRNKNRILDRADFQLQFSELFEEASRGHLRLFEPLPGGSGIQLYHLRMNEIMAGEHWANRYNKKTLSERQLDLILKEGDHYPALKPSLPITFQTLIGPSGGVEHTWSLEFVARMVEKVTEIVPASLAIVTTLSIAIRSSFKMVEAKLLTDVLQAHGRLTSLALDFHENRLSSLPKGFATACGTCQASLMVLKVKLTNFVGLEQIGEIASLRLSNLQALCVDVSGCGELVSIEPLTEFLHSLTKLEALQFNLHACSKLENLAESFKQLASCLRQLACNSLTDCQLKPVSGQQLKELSFASKVRSSVDHAVDLLWGDSIGRSIDGEHFQPPGVENAINLVLAFPRGSSPQHFLQSFPDWTSLAKLDLDLSACTEPTAEDTAKQFELLCVGISLKTFLRDLRLGFRRRKDLTHIDNLVLLARCPALATVSLDFNACSVEDITGFVWGPAQCLALTSLTADFSLCPVKHLTELVNGLRKQIVEVQEPEGRCCRQEREFARFELKFIACEHLKYSLSTSFSGTHSEVVEQLVMAADDDWVDPSRREDVDEAQIDRDDDVWDDANLFD